MKKQSGDQKSTRDNPAPLLDRKPFPFTDPRATTLIRCLCDIFTSTGEGKQLATHFDVRVDDIPQSDSSIASWTTIIFRLSQVRKLRPFIQRVVEIYSAHYKTALLKQLLENTLEPDTVWMVQADHLTTEDIVTEPEARLFYDDLTLEVNRIQLLIESLRCVLAVAPSVCRLLCSNSIARSVGTGFRFGEEYVMTNYHVLFPAKEVSETVVAEFSYDSEFSKDRYSLLGTKVVGADEALDWAVVEIKGMSENVPRVQLSDNVPAAVGDSAFILQHPDGLCKRLGYARNRICEVRDQKIYYLTDTSGGSSGAPVFNAEGRIIALHRAGGRPMEVAGRPPIIKNEGVEMRHILPKLKLARLI